jgi:hypothetical protein
MGSAEGICEIYDDVAWYISRGYGNEAITLFDGLRIFIVLDQYVIDMMNRWQGQELSLDLRYDSNPVYTTGTTFSGTGRTVSGTSRITIEQLRIIDAWSRSGIIFPGGLPQLLDTFGD